MFPSNISLNYIMSNSPSNSPYHEKQSGTLCAIHASNNLLGHAAFTQLDFQTIKTTLGIPDDEEGRCRSCLRCMPTCCCRRCRQGGEGNFDANVLEVALAQHKIELRFWDARNNSPEAVLDALSKDECVGAMLNQQAGYHHCVKSALLRLLSVCFGQNGHWVALRKQDTGLHYVNLNSQLARPHVLEGDDLVNYLKRHLDSGSHILIASRKQQEEGKEEKDT